MLSTIVRVAVLLLLSAAWAGCQTPPAVPPPTDGLIQAQVMNALEGNPATMSARNVWLNNVSVSGGVVTLTGSVPSAETRDACEQVARTVSGVNGVRNQITVGAARPAAPIQPIQPIR